MKTLGRGLCFAFLALLATQQTVWSQQHVVVVLDDSGSMGDRMRTQQGRRRRIVVAKEALTRVLADLPAETQVGVVALNSTVGDSHWIVPFGTGSPSVWRANIERIQAEGGTPLGEFIKIGADRLLEARRQDRYGNYRLLVVTDGEATDENLLESYLPDVLSRGLILDVIGVDMQSDHSLATRVHSYRRADDDTSLQQAISDVFAEPSADDQDAADGFEMLAALPEGFVEQALQALAGRGDEPIQETEGRGVAGNSVGRTTRRAGRATGLTFAGLGGMLCCLMGLVVSGVVAALVLAGRKRGRR